MDPDGGGGGPIVGVSSLEGSTNYSMRRKRPGHFLRGQLRVRAQGGSANTPSGTLTQKGALAATQTFKVILEGAGAPRLED